MSIQKRRNSLFKSSISIRSIGDALQSFSDGVVAARRNSDKIIKTVQVDQYTDSQINAPSREQRYTVTPNPASADADDDFGFNETTSFFQDAKNFDPVSGEDK